MLALVGPTASGKSEAALRIALELNAEVISVDSMLVYRGMDVGTAKPSRAERSRVAHHLIDVADPSEPFSVARFKSLAREALEEIAEIGGRPLLVGGSGLYFRAIVDDLEFPGTDRATREALETEAAGSGAGRMHERLAGLDPVAAGKIEPGNVRRTVRALEVVALTGRRFSEFAAAWDSYPPERVRVAGVRIPREVLKERIEGRVARMIERGLLEEVGSLIARGFGGWLTSSQAIGYAEVARHLRGECSLEEAIAGTVRRTASLARRQMAWFRRDPRIRWFAAGEEGAEGVATEILEYLRG